MSRLIVEEECQHGNVTSHASADWRSDVCDDRSRIPLDPDRPLVIETVELDEDAALLTVQEVLDALEETS